MSEWFKTYNSYFHDPRVVKAGPEAALLNLAGVGHCNEHLTNGFVDVEIIPSLTGFRLECLAGAVGRLVSTGLWDPTAGGYLIVDYTSMGRTKKRVLHDRREWRKRKAKERQNKETSQIPSRRDSQRDTPRDSPRDSRRELGVSHATRGEERRVEENRTDPTPTPPAVGGASSGSLKAEPTPVDQVCALYRELFSEKYKADPPGASVRERPSVAEVVKQYGLPKALDLMRAYFASADTWVIRESHPLGGFHRKAGTLLAEMARKAGVVKDPPTPRPTVQYPQGGGFIEGYPDKPRQTIDQLRKAGIQV